MLHLSKKKIAVLHLFLYLFCYETRCCHGGKAVKSVHESPELLYRPAAHKLGRLHEKLDIPYSSPSELHVVFLPDALKTNLHVLEILYGLVIKQLAVYYRFKVSEEFATELDIPGNRGRLEQNRSLPGLGPVVIMFKGRVNRHRDRTPAAPRTQTQVDSVEKTAGGDGAYRSGN